MTISTYATLVAALDGANGWLHRSDLTARIPEFIALCETDLQVRCKLVEFETTSTIAITAGVGALPSGFVAMRSIYWDGDPDRPLAYITPERFDALRAYDSGDGYYYTISGSTIRTTPMGDGSVVATHSARFTPISATNATNAIVTDYPDCYLYGTLKQYALFSQDDAGVGKWGALMTEAVDRALLNNEQRKYAGASLAVRTR